MDEARDLVGSGSPMSAAMIWGPCWPGNITSEVTRMRDLFVQIK